MLFKSITLSHKSDMNNSFSIIFIKVNTIKVNVIKSYTKNTHLITKKCDIIGIFFEKNYIIIRDKSSSSFLIIFLVTKQSGRIIGKILEVNLERGTEAALSLFLCDEIEKHQQLCHTFIGPYSYQDKDLKGSLKTALSHISWVLY